MTRIRNEPWFTVDELFHATHKEVLTMAEKDDSIAFESTPGTWQTRKVCHFSCKLWHRYDKVVRPTISPWGSKLFFLPVRSVFRSPNDFLIPLKPDIWQSPGGRTYIEMVYVRRADIDDQHLTPELDEWRLRNNQIIQMQP